MKKEKLSLSEKNIRGIMIDYNISRSEAEKIYSAMVERNSDDTPQKSHDGPVSSVNKIVSASHLQKFIK